MEAKWLPGLKCIIEVATADNAKLVLLPRQKKAG
jgi:hypothetical protein